MFKHGPAKPETLGLKWHWRSSDLPQTVKLSDLDDVKSIVPEAFTSFHHPNNDFHTSFIVYRAAVARSVIGTCGVPVNNAL